MKEMKIEVGKFYRTRDGHKVRIYATDGSGLFPVHGAIYYDDEWSISTWTSDGLNMRGNESGIDIISEWKQTIDDIGFDKSCLPKWAKFVFMDEDGKWCWSNEKPTYSLGIHWFLRVEHCGIIPPEHAPKNYKGDWKDSLFEVE